MFNIIKKALILSGVFIALYICSVLVLYLMTLTGITFSNVSTTAFYAALIATIVLFILHLKNKRDSSKN